MWNHTTLEKYYLDQYNKVRNSGFSKDELKENR